jgi:hypothetical protein
MRIRRPSHHGAAMSPAPRLTGATCQGHPRLRRSMVPRDRCRSGLGRRGATRLCGRARVRRLPLPEWVFGRTAPVQRLAGWALPSRQDLRLVKSIPPGDWRSVLVPVHQLYDGSDRPDSDSLQRRRSRGRSSDSTSTPSAVPVVDPSTAPQCLQSLLIRGGGCSCAPYRRRGPSSNPDRSGGRRDSPKRMGENVAVVEAADRAEKRPRQWTQVAPYPSRARSALPLSRACLIAR